MPSFSSLRGGVSLCAVTLGLSLGLTSPAGATGGGTGNWRSNAASSDWFSASNWEWTATPPSSASDDAYINANGAVISGGSARVNQIFVGSNVSGITLTVNSILHSNVTSLGWDTSGDGTIAVTGGSWTNDGTLTVGESGAGHVTVSAGGQVTSTAAVVARQAGSTGSISVDGGTSQWTESARLGIGYSGTGTLTVTNGGTVTSVGAIIGWNAGATGTATIDASRWNDTGTAYVGNEGNGTLTIRNGGTVTGVNAYVGTATTSTGTVTVTGASSSWTLNGILNVGYGGTTSSMTVTDGGQVQDWQGAIAVTAGSSAAVTVTGPGSVWSTITDNSLTNSGILSVGWSGTGTLTVSNGGTVSDTYAYLGDQAGSSGIATVGGANARWTTSEVMLVGKYGDGRLTVNSGGTVSATNGLTLAAFAGTTGTVTVDGGTVTTGGNLAVGQSGTGELTVTNGGTVSSSHGIIGGNSGTQGSASISGTNSNWTSSGNVYVGNVGNGSLTVSNGGTVSSVGGYVGTSGSSVGTVSLNGAGSAWTLSDTLIIGYESSENATVTVSNGAKLQDKIASVGDLAGSSGSVTVSGSGSRWDTVTTGGGSYAGYLNVGRLGNGTLTVSDGGTVTAYQAYLGNESGSSGTVSVAGAGSTLAVTNKLFVGTDGDGTLQISDGGRVSANTLVIAYDAATIGSVTLGGASGQAASTGTLDVSQIVFGNGIGSLSFNLSDANYTLAAGLSGWGNITKSAAGTLTLTGNGSGYTGNTTVNAGTLAVDGSLGGRLTVNSGATLSGTGSVGTVTVQSGGTHAPGTRQTVTGAYTLAAGSTLKIAVSDSQASQVAVSSGAVSIGGAALALTSLSSAPTLGRASYTIIDNQGSGAVSGTFASVDNQLAFYDANVSYTGGTGNDVVLNLERNAKGFEAVAATSNQRGVAGGLSQLGGSDGQTIRNAILGLNNSGAQNAYRQLSGNLYPATVQFNLNLGQQTGQQVSNRMANLRGQGATPSENGLNQSPAQLAGFASATAQSGLGVAPSSLGIGQMDWRGETVSAGGPQTVNGVWSQVVGGFSRLEGDGNSVTTTSDWTGLVAGYDRAITRDITLGGYVGYIRGTAEQKAVNSSLDTDSVMVGAYGEYRLDGWRLDGQVGWSRIAADSQRILSFGTIDRIARASYTDQTLSADVEAARPMELAPDWWMEPYAGAGLTRQYLDNFTETGAGSANLHRDSSTSSDGHTRLGTRFSTRMDLGETMVLIPQAGLGWQHLVGPSANQTILRFAGSSGSGFAVNSTDSARDTLTLSLGGSLVSSDGWQAYASYAPSISENQVEHSITVGTRLEW